MSDYRTQIEFSAKDFGLGSTLQKLNTSLDYLNRMVKTFGENFTAESKKANASATKLANDSTNSFKKLDNVFKKISDGIKGQTSNTSLLKNLYTQLHTTLTDTLYTFERYAERGKNFGKEIIGNVLKTSQTFSILGDEANDSASRISAWSKAIEIAGGNSFAFQNKISDLSDDLRNFNAGGELSQNLQAIMSTGVSVWNDDGSIKSSIQLIEEYSDTLKRFPKDIALAQAKSIGFDYRTAEFMLQNRKELNKAIKQGFDLSLDDRDIKKADKLNQKLRVLQLTFEHIKDVMGVSLLPKVDYFNDKLMKVSDWFKNSENMEKALKVVEAGFEAIAVVLSARVLYNVMEFSKQLSILAKNPVFMSIITALSALKFISDFADNYKELNDKNNKDGSFTVSYLNAVQSFTMTFARFQDRLFDDVKGIPVIGKIFGWLNKFKLGSSDEKTPDVSEKVTEENIKNVPFGNKMKVGETGLDYIKRKQGLKKEDLPISPKMKVIIERDEEPNKVVEYKDLPKFMTFFDSKLSNIRPTPKMDNQVLNSNNVSNIVNNNSTTSIGNVNITANSVDSQDIRNLANTTTNSTNANNTIMSSGAIKR